MSLFENHGNSPFEQAEITVLFCCMNHGLKRYDW